MSIRMFLITVVIVILFIFGSSSGKIEWKQALSHKNYYKESVPKASNANPTSLSEFGFETSGTNTQSRYPSTNNSPYSSPGGYPWQSVRDPSEISWHGQLEISAP